MKQQQGRRERKEGRRLCCCSWWNKEACRRSLIVLLRILRNIIEWTLQILPIWLWCNYGIYWQDDQEAKWKRWKKTKGSFEKITTYINKTKGNCWKLEYVKDHFYLIKDNNWKCAGGGELLLKKSKKSNWRVPCQDEALNVKVTEAQQKD